MVNKEKQLPLNNRKMTEKDFIWANVRAKAEDETQEQYQRFLQRKVRYCYEGVVILHSQ